MKTKDCEHGSFSRKEISEKFLDLTFKYKTQVCHDCGAYLYNKNYEKARSAWLKEIYQKNRSRFQIQAFFSQNLLDCANEYLLEHPGVSETDLLRILTTFYIDIIIMDQRLSKKFDSLLDLEVNTSLSRTGPGIRKGIQFKPRIMMDILAFNEAFDFKTSFIVEKSVEKMMTALTSQNDQVRPDLL
jgi:hypothetical protein